MSAATPRWVRFALPVFLVLAFALRVWFASPGLDADRFFDERYSLENVRALVLDRGEERRFNAYYPSLSFLPQSLLLAAVDGLHRLTGNEKLAVFGDTSDRFTPTAYFLCRLLTAIFAALSLWVTYLLGRRLFSPRVGLLAAVLFAAMPAHLGISGLFKPDMLVVLLTLLTFGWGLDAAERPGVRRALVAGGGVGLAVAAKYTGVGVAIPVAAATLFDGWRDRRRWGRLLLAASASVVTFLVLNPHLPVILKYLPRLQRIAEAKAEYYGTTHWSVVVSEGRFLWLHHGPVVLGFALAGLAGLAARAAGRWPVERRRRREAVALLAYVFGYSALFAAVSKAFRGHFYLPVAAFTSLAAAWAMVGLWDRLAARWPAVGRAAVAVPVWGVVAAALLWPTASITYREAVPSTYRQVEALLAGRLPRPWLRQVIYERRDRSLRPRVGANPMAMVAVERLAAVPTVDLDRADAEVFFAARLAAADGDFYLQRLAARSGEAVRFDPGWLHAWGPPLVAIVHGWSLLGEPEPLELVADGDGGNRFRAELTTPLAAGETVSLSIWVPVERRRPRPEAVELGGQWVPLVETRTGRGRVHFLTPRVAAAAADDLTLVFADEFRFPLPWRPRPELSRWRPGEE